MRGLFLSRLVAAAMALLAAWATFQLAATVLPARGDVALAAAAVLAFTPQMAFLSGAASNDSSAAALCTLALWRMARLLRAPSRRDAAWLGVALGAALLTKSSALALVPLIGLAALSTAISPRHTLRQAMQHATIALGIAALLGGWWYARNLLLYDTLYGRSLHLAMPWAREVPATLTELWADHELWLLFLSYWAAFGWGTIRWPDGLYWVLLILCALGGVGLGRGLWQRLTALLASGSDRDRLPGATRLARAQHLAASPALRTVALLALFALLVFLALLGWMQQVRAHWGRLLFPAAGALSVLLAIGLHLLWPKARLPLVLAACLALWALSAPWTAIRPALHAPPALAEAEVEALEGRVDWRIGDVAELLAVQPERTHTQVDGAWRVRLCWRALRRSEREWQALVHLVGPGDALVASYHSVPADGNASTRAWTPGEAFCETVDVILEEDVPAPAVYDIAVGLFEAATLERLPATTAAGEVVGSDFVTRLKVEPADPAWIDGKAETIATAHPRLTRMATPPRLQMAPFIGGAAGGAESADLLLLGYATPAEPVCAGTSATVDLLWQAGSLPPPTDLQVSLHLRPWPGEPAPPLAQADGPPRAETGGTGPDAGNYDTSLWSPREPVVDRRQVNLPADLPAGRYALVTGMYDLPGLTRAAVLDAPEGSSAGEIRLPTALEVIACAAP
jgi:hypothetical protein